MQNKIIELFQNNRIYPQSELHRFLNQPTLDEADVRYFVRFQKHFYHFVRVFSKMLARCAADIEKTEHRLHIIENLMCEHGLPAGKPHVATYRDYLHCLTDYLQQKPFSEQDFVLEADDAVGQIVRDFEHIQAAYPDNLLFLGGIEYIYAIISQDVVAFLNRIAPNLAQKQEHYAIHADLDWEHGWEFVASYLMLMADQKQAVCEQHMAEVLLQGAAHLIEYIEKLMQLEQVAAKPLGFYHSREDVAVEYAVIQQFLPEAKQLKILAICGGGENHITLANRLPETQFFFDFIDINPNQLALTQSKLTHSAPTFRQPEHTGKFEHLFAELRRYPDLQQACNVVFHRDNLIAYFGEAAVMGCRAAQDNPLVFATHFYHAFTQQPEHWNTQNIVANTPIQAKLTQANLHAQSFTQWNISQKNNQLQKTYDLIMLSNVLDWVAEADIPQALTHMARLSNENTLLLVRKLLSDYDIFAMAQQTDWQIITDSDRQPALKDPTGFYKQTFVLKLK